MNKSDEAINSLYHKVMEYPMVKECFKDIKEYDDYTSEHSYRVCIIALKLGIDYFLNEDELIELGVASLLHDYGKIKIPSEITKKKGKLTTEEYTVMKLHPLHGALWLQHFGFNARIIRTVAEHHEGISGQGYPFGKTYSALPVASRLVLVADIYDALTSQRVYRSNTYSPEEAVKVLLEDAKADINITRLLSEYVNDLSPSGQEVEV